MHDETSQSAVTPKGIPTGTNGEAEEPFPLTEEQLENWRWIYEQRSVGGFEEYRGQHIAVFRKQVLGASRDPDLLVKYLVLRDNVDPKQLVLTYVDRC